MTDFAITGLDMALSMIEPDFMDIIDDIVADVEERGRITACHIKYYKMGRSRFFFK